MIVNPAIEQYLFQIQPEREPILKEMESFGHSINFPILGPLVGAVLLQFTLAIGARRILELGSGFGYSAYWFSKGLPEDGMVYCTDFSAKNKERAENYFRRAKIDHKIQFMVGDAVEILADMQGEFDIILNDVQKTRYPDVFEPALKKLRRGGVLITDNVLWKGKVAEENEEENTRAIQKFNKMMFNSKSVISSILPLRDGLGICVKK